MKRKALRSFIIMMIAVLVVSMMPVTASAATKKPGQVKIVSFKVGAVSKSTNTCTVTIKWKKAKNAKKYVVYAKHGNSGWIKQKTCGKYIRKFKLTNVPAGDFAIKVQAVNKKKLGKFSKAKSKYIASPIYLQQYVAIRPRDKADKFTYTGNQMFYEEYLSEEDEPSFKSYATSLKNYYKVNCGLSNIKIIVRYVDAYGVPFERTY